MPDPNFETISASQVAGLFGLSPYHTKWTLWHAFKRQDMSLIEPPENERMRLGKMYQAAILERVAADHRLEVIANEADEYVRRGRIGCTRDAHMLAPDLGRVIVEAKRVHWLRWRDTWTGATAPMHIELQLQHQLIAEDAEHGIIACDNGDDDLIYYRRTRNPDTVTRIVEEVDRFFESLAADEEPDPLGSDVEIPTLTLLYAEERTQLEIVEDYEDDDLADTIMRYDRARGDETFSRKLKEQLRAKLLVRAGKAGIVKANGVTAYIKSIPVSAQICQPHTDPRELRKPSVQTRIAVVPTEPVRRREDPFSSEEGHVNG